MTEELQEIRSLAREFAAAELRPHVESWDHDAALGDGVLAQVAELGFFGMLAPESAGGMEVSDAAWLTALEELGWGEPAVALCVAWHGQVVRLVQQYGSEALRSQWLERLASGSALGCLALAEEDAGSEVEAASCVARADGDGFIISGTKRWVSNHRSDGAMVVLAHAEQGPTLFFLPGDAAGVVAAERDDTLGLRPLSIRTVRYEDVRVGADQVLGTPGDAATQLASVAGLDALGIGAVAVGIAQAALEHAAGYADVREQFGQKLRAFQGLQYKLATMSIHTAAARALLVDAAISGDPVRGSMAKVFASECAMQVSTDAVQVFGGYGYMRDYPVEKLMRDGKAMSLLGGADELHRVAIAQQLYED